MISPLVDAWRARRRRALAGVAVVCALVLGACSGGSDQRPTLGGADSGTTSEGSASESTTTTKPPFTSTLATAAVPDVPVYDAPGAASPSRSYQNPWHVNDDPSEPTVPLVFLVEETRDDGWVRVLLPERPNGTSGWVRAGDFTFADTQYHITVELGLHQITVANGEEVILQEPVAIGKPSTPTPPGRYYIRVLLQSPDPDSVYGPFAYGLSAHSDVLTEFNGGDGEVGIHGNNDASVLGQSVSAGCVRMSNEGITRLTQLLPLGTPVEIVA
ncbi:MAG TPA: L,D-transpeptidase [Acidimicrobiia bacterium]